MAPDIPTPTEADEIQRQMREVRAELRIDVQDLAVSTLKMVDLASYVKAYPWLCVGAALAAGYLVVPQRATIIRPDAEALIDLAKKHKLVVKMNEGPSQKMRGGLFAELLGLAAATLLQGGLKIATRQLADALGPALQPHSNGKPPGVTP